MNIVIHHRRFIHPFKATNPKIPLLFKGNQKFEQKLSLFKIISLKK